MRKSYGNAVTAAMWLRAKKLRNYVLHAYIPKLILRFLRKLIKTFKNHKAGFNISGLNFVFLKPASCLLSMPFWSLRKFGKKTKREKYFGIKV